jgi:murein DD-endopeptidase MepM/ murein hydrolase activator NlpD
MLRGPRFSTAWQIGSQRVTDRADGLPGSMRPRHADRMTTLRSRSLSLAGLSMLAASSPTLWTAAAAASPGPAQAGREWVWPLEPVPRVVRPFEPPASRWGPGHRGIDLLGTAGQPVLAIGSGSVRFAGAVAGRGVVVISHGALQSTYEPVTTAVHRGERVRAGEVVGLLQTVHSHCSPEVCLHLGLRHGSVYIDPLSVLTARQVRLLPLTPTDRTSSSGVPDGPRPTDSAPAQMTSAVSGRAGVRKPGAVRTTLALAAIATVASGLFVLVRGHARG